MKFVNTASLYREGWDTLSHAKFWKDVITMSSDSFLINVASCRKPLEKVSREAWTNQTEPEKTKYKDSINCIYNYEEGTNLFVTSGKAEFYELKKTMPDISKAIGYFQKYNCDPFYAQAILLIESPGKSGARSYVGARGPFQLMRSVARKYGLRVSKTRDDRTDLEKSARAASRLINTACIPYVKSYLSERNISFNENDLWFRLLVLHAYHAGAGNVQCVINTLNPASGGVDLFRQIWQTECGRFKNESQNYSQIALAALISFNEIIGSGNDTVYLVQGDKLMKSWKRKSFEPAIAVERLHECMVAYEADLVDGTIPYEYFIKKINQIRKEILFIASTSNKELNSISINQYPASEAHIDSVAASLLKRQRYEEAIKLLKWNIDMHPVSNTAYENLARAYAASGNKHLASIYANKSAAIGKKELIKGID